MLSIFKLSILFCSLCVFLVPSNVIDFVLVWDRFPTVSFNHFILVLQSFRENSLINTLAAGVDFYRN